MTAALPVATPANPEPPPSVPGFEWGVTAMLDELRLDEGVRLRAYTDSRGFTTIGIGRNLTVNGISEGEATALCYNDLCNAAQYLDDDLPWWRDLPPAQQRVMLNLCFNMGIGTLLMFKAFLGAMQKRDWQDAADALRASKWYGEVGNRGPRMVARLLSGQFS